MTSSRASGRASQRAVFLAVVALAAAAAPQAHAEDGVADVPALAVSVPDPTQLAGAILEDVAAAALPAVAPEVVPPELPAAPAQPAAAEPVPTGTAAAPSPEPVSEPSPATAPVAPELTTEPDPPTAPESQPAQEPEPAAVQQGATNVNVSVRVDSPGEDGAVTQVNVAVGAGPQYQEPQGQYQPPVSPDPVEIEAVEAASAAADEATDGWNWSWNWSCGDAPVGDIAIPVGVLQHDWNWNWNWICGGDDSDESENAEESGDGYQAPTTQYRPININISIRINSPGDNGPVVQTNVAVGVTLPASPVSVPSAPPVSPQEPAPTPMGVPSLIHALIDPVVAAIAIDLIPLAGDVVEDAEDCCLLRQPRGAAGLAEAPISVVLSASTPVEQRGITAGTGDTAAVAAVVARLALRAKRAATAATAPPRPEARPARRASTRAPADDGEGAAVVTGGLGFAPLPGSDRLLPWIVLLGFSFLFSFASSSLVSAGSRPTPGADADEPPTRPG